MFDDKVVDRWVGQELQGLARGLVTHKRSLVDLLAEERPIPSTRRSSGS